MGEKQSYEVAKVDILGVIRTILSEMIRYLKMIRLP